jgi:hypothetical protein
MANRRFEQFLYSLIKKKTELDGSISLSAAAAVSASDIPGVASVSKTATGEYTITLSDKYAACYGVHASLSDNGEALWAKPGAVDVSSAKTVIIKTVDETGAEADATAAATIWVKIVLRNSSVA